MFIAKTKLTPLLFYGVEVFGNCDATSQHKLLVAFNKVARYTTQIPHPLKTQFKSKLHTHFQNSI